MSSIIAVTFNPSLWTAGSGSNPNPGSKGYNAYSVWLDKDGTTCWAFEYFGAGFARFNLSDGSVVHQDAMMGTPDSTNFWYNREDGTSFWQQDNAGHYFAIPNNGTSNRYLNKFSIGAGSSGNLLNGYCTDPVTFDLFTMTPAFNHFVGFEAMRVFTSGGVNYCVLMTDASGGSMYVINTDTMAFVGSYTATGTGRGWATFIDSNGDIWGVFTTTNFATSNISLVKWHPADGATSGTLNFTTAGTGLHTVALGAAFASAVFAFATYVPSNNSVFIGGSINFTGPCANVSLSSFTVTATHADDLSFFYNGTLDVTESAMDNGVVSSLLAIPGDQSGHSSQQGGIINLIDPETLALSSSFNVTTAIFSQGGLPAPSTDFPYDPLGTMQYNGTLGVVAYEFIGSPVYIVPLAPPVPPTLFVQAVPNIIVAGQNSTVSWATTNATSLVSPELGTLPLSGSMEVSPTATSFYHFTATGTGGSVIGYVEVEVISNQAAFSLQKLILSLKQDRIPNRGRNK